MTDKLKEYHLEERELYRKLPHLHNWWNKLYVAETFGHLCGPGGTEIPETREYVIRPIYNLAGMGICTTIKTLEKGDITSVPPGYFWCEYFEGNHYSATYEKVDKGFYHEWKVLHNWQGWNKKENVVKFRRWLKLDWAPELPKELQELDVPFINVEYKGDKVIELHFRPSGNPDGTYEDKWNEYIPVWEDTPKSFKNELYNQGFRFIKNPFDDWMDDLEPYMKERRLGYFVR
jgi:hypothetical protein|tara:strand:- start:2208 stop:2903 length:696 start_codon:yes stop_codon:yes gene_type:complete